MLRREYFVIKRKGTIVNYCLIRLPLTFQGSNNDLPTYVLWSCSDYPTDHFYQFWSEKISLWKSHIFGFLIIFWNFCITNRVFHFSNHFWNICISKNALNIVSIFPTFQEMINNLHFKLKQQKINAQFYSKKAQAF